MKWRENISAHDIRHQYSLVNVVKSQSPMAIKFHVLIKWIIVCHSSTVFPFLFVVFFFSSPIWQMKKVGQTKNILTRQLQKVTKNCASWELLKEKWCDNVKKQGKTKKSLNFYSELSADKEQEQEMKNEWESDKSKHSWLIALQLAIFVTLDRNVVFCNWFNVPKRLLYKWKSARAEIKERKIEQSSQQCIHIDHEKTMKCEWLKLLFHVWHGKW